MRPRPRRWPWRRWAWARRRRRNTPQQHPRQPRPRPADAGAIRGSGSAAWCCTAISGSPSSTTSRSRSEWRRPGCSACLPDRHADRARPGLPRAGHRHRRHARHRRRDEPAPLRRHAASVLAFLGMTIPRFLLALVILYWLAFVVGSSSHRVAELAGLHHAALVGGQAVGPRAACLAGGAGRDLRRPRLQPAHHALQPARRDAPAVHRGGAGERVVAHRRRAAPCRAERAAPAGHAPGRHHALHDFRRAGGGAGAVDPDRSVR